jgi:hypothetical protein
MLKMIREIGSWMLCVALILSSCKDEIVPINTDIDPNDVGKDVPIALDLRGLFANNAPTYATNYPGTLVPGTVKEDSVKDVLVYVFNDMYHCERILHESTPPVPNPIGPVLVKSGVKHFVVVVNGGGNATLETNNANASSVSYSTLLQQLSDARTGMPESPFLMTAIKNNELVLPDKPFDGYHDIPVEVVRACAKVTLSVKKSGKAENHNIKITGITMINGADRVPIFSQPTTPSYTFGAIPDVTKTAFNPSGGGNVTTAYEALLDTFYTYESLCGADITRAVRFEIATEVNVSSNKRTAKFYLATNELSPGDSVFDVKRNHWYDVMVNIVDPGMDSVYITVNACPWNLAEPQDTIIGGGYQVIDMASPFKLVKNYTAHEIFDLLHPEIAMIEQHTKGASWIDLKVGGYSWDLKFDPLSENPANDGAKMSLDSGEWKSEISGPGDEVVHRVYIYRPYVENAEPKSGPTFSLFVGGVRVRNFVVQPRDTTPIPTNSYILRPELSGVPVNKTHAYIPLKGVYRYWEDYLLENGKAIPNGIITADILWKDSTGNIIKNVYVINANKRDSAYIYVEAGPVQGNAVVAMKVGSDIYWSFHLWVTEYNPYEPAGQKTSDGTVIFMDRNLGALTNQYDEDGNARGLFYQFGRKDPFPRTAAWDNSTFKYYDSEGGSILTGTLPAAVSPPLRPLAAIPATLRNPKTFYTNSTWLLSTENDSLWDTQGGNKSAFDPCPEGWRVPVQRGNGAADSPWDSSFPSSPPLAPEYGKGLYHSNLGYFPFSGYISSAGNMEKSGTGAYFWTSFNLNESLGTGLYITTPTSASSVSISKNYAVSVRCVKDTNYRGSLFGH